MDCLVGNGFRDPVLIPNIFIGRMAEMSPQTRFEKRTWKIFPTMVFLLLIFSVLITNNFANSANQKSVLSPTYNVLSPAEKSQGFELLFDGTYEGFKKNFTQYGKGDSLSDTLPQEWKLDSLNQSMITTQFTNDIRSKKKYRDFDFRGDFRSNGSQGFYYRALLSGDVLGHTGPEYKLFERPDEFKDSTEGSGGVWLLYMAKINYQYSFTNEKWNSVRIVVIADSVEHWMNGSLSLAYRIHSPDFWKHYDERGRGLGPLFTMKVPGDRNSGYIEEGYLGIRGDWAGLWNLRNMRINSVNPKFGPVDEAVDIYPLIDKKNSKNLHQKNSNLSSFTKKEYSPSSPTIKTPSNTKVTPNGKIIPLKLPFP